MSVSSPNQGTSRLGAAVRARRGELRLSLEALAKRVACSKSYLSAIENARCGPPSAAVLRKLEAALDTEEGLLLRLADLQATPGPIRRELEELQRRQLAAAQVAALLRDSKGAADSSPGLDEAYQSGKLRALIDQLSPPDQRGPTPVPLPLEVPVINRVQAGYPREFTDLGYPARVADEYVRCPDLADADAFAARVVGDSMQPDYREGDIVIFSPARDVRNGSDCFARLAPDDETTFKRVFFETGPEGEELIRLQPMNQAYPPQTLPRERVVGLYAAVSVQRQIG